MKVSDAFQSEPFLTGNVHEHFFSGHVFWVGVVVADITEKKVVFFLVKVGVVMIVGVIGRLFTGGGLSDGQHGGIASQGDGHFDPRVRSLVCIHDGGLARGTLYVDGYSQRPQEGPRVGRKGAVARTEVPTEVHGGYFSL